MKNLIYSESRAYLVMMIFIFFIGFLGVFLVLLESIGFPLFAAFIGGILAYFFLLYVFRQKLYLLDFYSTHFEKKYLFNKKVERIEYSSILKVEKLESLYNKNLHIYIDGKYQPLNIQYSDKLNDWLDSKIKG